LILTSNFGELFNSRFLKFNSNCPKFQFLTKIWIFDQNLNFWQKFWFLTTISFFDQNFDFWPQFQFLAKISTSIKGCEITEYWNSAIYDFESHNLRGDLKTDLESVNQNFLIYFFLEIQKYYSCHHLFHSLEHFVKKDVSVRSKENLDFWSIFCIFEQNYNFYLTFWR